MELFIHLVGFLGGWLLVAGPLFQASIELREEELDHTGFEQSRKDIPVPPRISPWWWLLPPVAYVKSQRRKRAYRDATFAALNPTQRAQFMGFMNKAQGWLIVATGAFAIALKETWELVELLHLPLWSFWVAVVVLAVGVVVNTAIQVSRGDAMLHIDDPEYRQKQRAERQAQVEARRASKGEGRRG